MDKQKEQRVYDKEPENLKFYHYRIMIYEWLLQLSDWEYLNKAWTDGDFEFGVNLGKAVTFLIEDCGDVLISLSEKSLPYGAIGYYLKDGEEAQAMYDFAYVLDDTFENIPQRTPNNFYLESPYMPKLVKAAQKLLTFLLEKDKDDIELLDYLREYVKDRGINITI